MTLDFRGESPFCSFRRTSKKSPTALVLFSGRPFGFSFPQATKPKTGSAVRQRRIRAQNSAKALAEPRPAGAVAHLGRGGLLRERPGPVLPRALPSERLRGVALLQAWAYESGGVVQPMAYTMVLTTLVEAPHQGPLKSTSICFQSPLDLLTHPLSSLKVAMLLRSLPSPRPPRRFGRTAHCARGRSS